MKAITCPKPKKGTPRWIKRIDGKRICIRLIDEISRPQIKSRHPKCICLQMLQHDSDGRIEYRFAYHMFSPKVKHWVYAQYALMIPAEDLKWFLKEAKKRKWEGF